MVAYNLKVDDELWWRFKNTITRAQGNINDILVEMIRERVRRFEGRKKSGSPPPQRVEKKKEAGSAQKDVAGSPVQKGETEGKPNGAPQAEPGEVAEAGGVQKDAGSPPQEEEKGGALG